MTTNRRIFYAVQAVGFAKNGTATYTAAHGVQSLGINTKFNLEQFFELGQIAIYQNAENIPDVEVSLEKCLDGYPLLYHLATNGATSASLAGRSNVKTILGMSIYTDTQNSASGSPVAQCVMSGMFVSSLSYDIQVQGAAKESVTLVGNNKWWNVPFTAPTFNNTDTPFDSTNGVNRRQNIKFGASSPTVPTKSLLPTDIPGISASGTNELQTDGSYAAHIQSIKISTNLGREAIYELGHKGVYFRYVNFPIEVKADFETISSSGDGVQALEDALNLGTQKIYIIMDEGTKLDLGTQNKMSSITQGGGNAAANGGNVSNTFSYITYNDLTVTHPQDPSGL